MIIFRSVQRIKMMDHKDSLGRMRIIFKERNMEKYIDGIARKIVEVAEEENKQLMAIANNDANSKIGIFHMPELAFAYECGKQIMQNSNEIFGNNIPKWYREYKLENEGLTDLVFVFDDGQTIAIEFKMRDTGDAYINDLDKLSKFKDHKVTRMFCAIIDTLEKDLPQDGRVDKINAFEENNFKVKKVLSYKTDEFTTFKTNQTWYTSNVSALVGIWVLETLVEE